MTITRGAHRKDSSALRLELDQVFMPSEQNMMTNLTEHLYTENIKTTVSIKPSLISN